MDTKYTRAMLEVVLGLLLGAAIVGIYIAGYENGKTATMYAAMKGGVQ